MKLLALFIYATLYNVVAQYNNNDANVLKYFYKWNTTHFEKNYLEVPSDSISLQNNFYSKNREIAELQSSSQEGQDAFVYESSNHKTNGFYVELAANHYKELSNSYALETYKSWNGICIEANPQYFEGLLANRRCTLIASPISSMSNQNITFRLNTILSGMITDENDPKLSDEKEKINLVTVTLNKVLDFLQAPPVIDYLSLDIEGAEYLALKHFDFGAYIFLMLTVERPVIKLHRLLIHNGYRYVKLTASFGDCLYVHYTHPNFNTLMEQYRAEGKQPHYGWYSHHMNVDAPYLNVPTWESDRYNPVNINKVHHNTIDDDY